MEPDPLPERIIQLETHLAFQQRAYEALNEVVIEQTARLDRMERRLLRLEEELRRAGDAPRTDAGPADEKPPHY